MAWYLGQYLFKKALQRQAVKTAVDKDWNNWKTIPAWDLKKVRPKSEVIRQAKKEGNTVHFANLMDLCRLKIAELAKHLQQYKERVVLQGYNVKDEGYRAAFTEQGASACQMAGAKLSDTLSKVPGMAGETSDAVSACMLARIGHIYRVAC